MWSSVSLAHGVAVRVYTSSKFSAVVEVAKGCDIYSNVYIEVLGSSPRVAVAVGEKYFFRVDNYLVITVIAIDGGDHVVLEVVATGVEKGSYHSLTMERRETTWQRLLTLCAEPSKQSMKQWRRSAT
jgi:hypothetical protein